MDLKTKSERIARMLEDSGLGPVTTKYTTGGDNKTECAYIQFQLFPKPINDLYYRSVIEMSSGSEGPYISRYEFRLPHFQRDGNDRHGVEQEYMSLLGACETESIADWTVSVNETGESYAPHVESFYAEEDAPEYSELHKYVMSLKSEIDRLGWSTHPTL